MRDPENPFQGEIGPSIGLVGTLATVGFVAFVAAFVVTGIGYGLHELWGMAVSAAHAVRGVRS